jgi:hypothetical protein
MLAPSIPGGCTTVRGSVTATTLTGAQFQRFLRSIPNSNYCLQFPQQLYRHTLMSDFSIKGPLSDDQMLRLLQAGRTFRVKGTHINDVKAQVARLGFKDAYKVWPIAKDVKLKLLAELLE